MISRTVNSAQFEKMVEGSMARGPFYNGDTDREEANSRVYYVLKMVDISESKDDEAPLISITQDEFVAMIDGTLARGPFFTNDPDSDAASARVRQMLSRASISIEKQ